MKTATRAPEVGFWDAEDSTLLIGDRKRQVRFRNLDYDISTIFLQSDAAISIPTRPADCFKFQRRPCRSLHFNVLVLSGSNCPR